MLFAKSELQDKKKLSCFYIFNRVSKLGILIIPIFVTWKSTRHIDIECIQITDTLTQMRSYAL